LISDDKPVGTDWEEILILEEIILHSLMSVVSTVLLLCVIYEVFFWGVGSQSRTFGRYSPPTPCPKAAAATMQAEPQNTCEIHNFIYSFSFVHMVHLKNCFRDHFILRMKSEWKKFCKIVIVILTYAHV
jgi:hypothetical protein